VHKIPYIIYERLEEAFNAIQELMFDHGLQLAAEKTEALVITKKRKRDEISVPCLNHIIKSKKSLRHLGVEIDKKVGFSDYTMIVAERASVALRQLGFFMPNMAVQDKSRVASYLVSQAAVRGPFLSG